MRCTSRCPECGGSAHVTVRRGLVRHRCRECSTRWNTPTKRHLAHILRTEGEWLMDTERKDADTIPGRAAECWVCLGDGHVHHQGIPVPCPLCVPNAREIAELNINLRRSLTAEDRAAMGRGLEQCGSVRVDDIG